MKAQKELDSGTVLGRHQPTTVCRVSMRPYALADDAIRPTAAQWPSIRPDWLPKVKPQSRSWVTDGDLQRSETFMRELLQISSNLDAILAAVGESLRSADDVSPFVI